MTALIVVIDYGLGNIRSVRRGLERSGADVKISHKSEAIREADALVLPGVGAFDDGMRNLRVLEEEIEKAVERGTPLLGICLGLQMLLESSEEGEEEGLGLFPGCSRLFEEGKVPHMGWNEINGLDHPVFDGVAEGSYVYFVHSYYAETDGPWVAAVTDYHVEFPAAIAKGDIVGLQFHPEKSGEVGLRVLDNFVRTA